MHGYREVSDCMRASSTSFKAMGVLNDPLRGKIEGTFENIGGTRDSQP